LHGANKKYLVTEVGIRTPKEIEKELDCGEVGYLTATIKDIQDVFPGETITWPIIPPRIRFRVTARSTRWSIAAFIRSIRRLWRPQRCARKALFKRCFPGLYEPESSQALGFGFRVGFLGLLHMDVVQERLEREYNLNLILTAPSVKYQVDLTNGRL
jgi:GTP-binding protein LepA